MTVRARTRVEPQRFTGGRTLHVYPPDHQGPKEEPSFTSLLHAYYGAGLGDWSVVHERPAQPGDTIVVHAGLYRPERLNYVDPQMAPFDGTFGLTLDGTADRPITIMAAGDGEVVFDGAGNHVLFDVTGTRHHIFDGLTIRNTDVGMLAGRKEVTGAVALTVKNCRFEQVGFGVWTEYAGSSDFYLADNLFLGRDDRFRLVGWTGPLWASAGPYGSHLLTSYYAIKVYGPGHVIARNAIAYFHDGIGISTYGTPERDPERRASSIDIYGNDIHMMGDDFVETDGGVHNVRVFDNRGVNAAHGGYSAQPVFGGPVYFIRNLAYHVPSGVAFKFSAKPAGLFVFHNTLLSEQVARDPSSNVHFRNNLFLGRDTPERGDHGLGQRHAGLQLRPQRLPAERRRRRAVRLPRARRRRDRIRADGGAVAQLPDARRGPRRDRHRSARNRSGLRRLRADAAAGSAAAPRRLPRHGSRLPAEARRPRRGRRRRDPDRQRRLRRARPRPRRARGGTAGAALWAAVAGLAAVLSLTR